MIKAANARILISEDLTLSPCIHNFGFAGTHSSDFRNHQFHTGPLTRPWLLAVGVCGPRCPFARQLPPHGLRRRCSPVAIPYIGPAMNDPRRKLEKAKEPAITLDCALSRRPETCGAMHCGFSRPGGGSIQNCGVPDAQKQFRGSFDLWRAIHILWINARSSTAWK